MLTYNSLCLHVGIDAIKIQKDQFQQLNPFPTIKYSILPRTKRVVYSTDDLSKISRPAMVISETAITSNHYLDNHADIQRVRFTAIPFAFLDRRDWNDIRRGVTSAETEMKVGESKRRIPFLTNSSALRNKIMEKFIYKNFEIDRSESSSNTNNDLGNGVEFDGEYDDGLEHAKCLYLENI